MNLIRFLSETASRLALILIALWMSKVPASGQAITHERMHKIAGESVSPQLHGKILKVLFDGVADLYFETEGAANYYYITDINGRLFTLSVPQKESELTTWSGRQGAVSVLKVFMHDAPELHGQIESCKLDKYGLTALMHAYHVAVTGPDQGIEYELPPPALIPHFGIFGGYNADLIKTGSTGDLSGMKLDPAYYPTVGMSVGTILPRISRNLSITFDISAGKRYVYGYYDSRDITQPNTVVYKELHLHNYLIMSDLLLGYNFGSGSIRPFVSGGICTRTVLSDQSRIETDLNIDHVLIISDTDDYVTDEKTSLGMMLSLGLTFDISDKISLSTAINYSELIVAPSYLKYRSAGLSIGVNF